MPYPNCEYWAWSKDILSCEKVNSEELHYSDQTWNFGRQRECKLNQCQPKACPAKIDFGELIVSSGRLGVGAVAEFKCPPGHVYRQDTVERYVESKETSKSVDVTCEVQEGFPQWVTSHERETLKPCRKGKQKS